MDEVFVMPEMSQNEIRETIRRTVNSYEAAKLILESIDKNLPAIEGVDRILQEKLGENYGSHNKSTNYVGRICAEFLRELGLVRKDHLRDGDGKGRADTTPGCVARYGTTWQPLSPRPDITQLPHLE